MEIKLIQLGSILAAEIISDKIIINNVQDALDVMSNASYQGAQKIIIKESCIAPDFFNLGTKLAGDILQKFVNYHMSLAIIGDFSKYKSKNFKDFIYESNKTGKILFLTSIEEL